MTGMRRILIADDNHDAADSMAMVLEFLGYETCTAYDGQQAVDQARTFSPDVVILDINMPVMDGYAAASALRMTGGERVILVALTGASAIETPDKARQHGFDAHFSKPLAGDDLEAVLQRLEKKP